MRIIGLTGPSGTGKSTLAALAAEQGYYVIDCDAVSAEVSGQPAVLQALEQAFGSVVQNNRLNRKALAAKAFASEDATARLNAVMLPPIAKQMEAIIRAAEQAGHSLFLLDAPTLFESGIDKRCDAVIAVLASPDLRRARIAKRDGLCEQQLQDRLRAAKPDAFYTEKTEHILYNNGDIIKYTAAAKQMLSRLKQE